MQFDFYLQNGKKVNEVGVFNDSLIIINSAQVSIKVFTTVIMVVCFSFSTILSFIITPITNFNIIAHLSTDIPLTISLILWLYNILYKFDNNEIIDGISFISIFWSAIIELNDFWISLK